MFLYDFYTMLTKLRAEDNYKNNKKEILVGFAEQFEKINFLNLSREKKELMIFTQDIEKNTKVKNITDLQNYIDAYFINIDNKKHYTIKIFSKDKKEYDVKDVAEDIDDIITIGVI